MLDPKPEARYVAGPDEWNELLDELKERFNLCQACGADGWLVPLTAHHIVPKSLGGGDVRHNLARVCGTGTTGCHGRIENREFEACALLRAGMTKWQTVYVLETKGQDFLDRYYPLSGEEDGKEAPQLDGASVPVEPLIGPSRSSSAESGEANEAVDPSSPLDISEGAIEAQPLGAEGRVNVDTAAAQSGSKSSAPSDHSDDELEPCSACQGTGKRKKREKRDPSRPRTNVGIAVPKDQQEDGAEVLATLIDECRKELVPQMGWKDNVPPYFVLTAVLADWLSSRGAVRKLTEEDA